MEQQPVEIHPIFDNIADRSTKEQVLEQTAKALWLTGLSGSGKSTLAIGLERKLLDSGYICQILDGDNIRSGINKNLGFSIADRHENIRRIAEVNKLFLSCGIITINCFISPTEESRSMAKDIIGRADFLEIYVSTPLQVCEGRDVKGLYKKARKGEIKDFTGISSIFEPPKSAFFAIDTQSISIGGAVDKLYSQILPLVKKH
jgi:adenylylsulfate kinase